MKKKQLIRAVTLIMTAVMLLALYAPTASAADSNQFDLDVIFVIDNSGSMLQSDPNRLALTASNLFIDMCEDSDSRVGYVMYTENITAFQQLTDIVTFSSALKNAIEGIRYQPDGDTDIALGVEKAFELLEIDSLYGKSHRKPVMILLSDGNTDLPKGNTRTVAQSLESLEYMKQRLADNDVPVYTIGFNYDGRLDIEAMKSIADKTGAIAQEAKTADELPLILRRIYGNLTGANSISFPPIPATGEPQGVTIPIENGSIYKATVTIMSANEVKDISLTSPDGTRYSQFNSNQDITLNRDTSGKYTLLTLYRPDKGDWELTFTGTKDDIVSIDLLSVYDLTLVFENPVTSYRQAEVSWHLEDSDGKRINDTALLSAMDVVMHLDNGKTMQFPVGQTSAVFDLEPGDYEAYLTMKGGDINRTSNTKSFSVPDVKPVSPLTIISDSKSITLVTIFKNESSFYLDELISYTSENKPLSVKLSAGDWVEFIEIDYDKMSESVNIKALKSGKSETEITVTGADGSTAYIYLYTNTYSGLLFIIIGGAILLIIAGLIIFLMLRRKPYLDMPMREFGIQVNLPDHMIEYIPPEARFRLEHVKGKRSLAQIINYNREHTALYNNAFAQLDWFVGGMVFSAKNREEMEIVVPVHANYAVLLDRNRLVKPTVCRFNKRTQLHIELIREHEYYEIIIGDSGVGDIYGGGSGMNTGAYGTDPFSINSNNTGGFGNDASVNDGFIDF